MKCEYSCVTTVSAPNQSLKARTESDDGIQDLDNIKTVGNNIINSLAIMQYEFKNGKVTSQQCEYKSGIVQCEYKNDKVTSQQCEYNKNKLTAFQLQTASKNIQWKVPYAGFAYLFKISGKHVEHKCRSISSSPIKFWLREMNAVFVGLNIFLSSEANDIFHIVLGVSTLNGVALNSILSCTTTTDFYYTKKIYLQHDNEFCVWHKQESYNMYCNIEQQWFIFQALNHEIVLPVAGTTILVTCGGCSSTFLHYGCLLLYPHYNTHPFSLLSTSIQWKQPSYFPCVVMSVCSEPTTSLAIDSFFVQTLDSSNGYGCAPGNVSSIVPTLFPSATSLDPGVVMSMCSEPTTSSNMGSFFVPTLNSSNSYGCAPGLVSSTVSTSFPSFFFDSVPSILYSDVPGGVSHWATSFASCSFQGLLSFSFQGLSPGSALGFLSRQKLLVTNQSVSFHQPFFSSSF